MKECLATALQYKIKGNFITMPRLVIAELKNIAYELEYHIK
jgi:hypothetical protein